MGKQCLPNFNFFFFPEAIDHIQGMGLVVALYQHKKRGDKYVISHIYKCPLSFLRNQWQNHIEVVTIVSLWERIKKLWKMWADQTWLRICSWQNTGSRKKLKVQVQILLQKLCRKGCRENSVHKRQSWLLVYRNFPNKTENLFLRGAGTCIY